MSGLLYFIGGINTPPSREQLEANGLIGETVCSSTECMRFVDGSGGMIFTLKGKFKGEFYIGFRNETQNWEYIPNTNLWVGYNLNDKPTPKDFLKEDFINGHQVKLGDGNDYIIPLARKFEDGTFFSTLPSKYKMVSSGVLEMVTVSKYLLLQKIASKLLGLFQLSFEIDVDADASEIQTDLQRFNICVDVLRFNYNLSFLDVSVLGLFDSDNCIKILMAVIDGPYVESLQSEKKKDLLDMKNGLGV